MGRRKQTQDRYKDLRPILYLALSVAATGGWMVGSSGKPKTTLYLLLISAIILSESFHWILDRLRKGKG